jgi:hypothetical protein
MFLTDIGIVLDYKGALLGGFIAYGLPGLMFLSLRRKSGLHEAGWQKIRERAPTDEQNDDEDDNSLQSSSSSSSENADQRSGVDILIPPSLSSSSSSVSASSSSVAIPIRTVSAYKPGLRAWPANLVSRVTTLSFIFLWFAALTGVMGVIVTTRNLME